MDDIRRRVAMTIYESIGGDPNKHFDTVEEIYEEIDRIYDSQDYRVDVEPLHVRLDANGTYIFEDENVQGYKPVEIDIDIPLDEGSYAEGYSEGVNAQRSRLESITIDSNGTYVRNDGYNKVEVIIDTQSYYDSGYNVGVEDGIDEQKSKLESITITENGTYNKDDGYNKVNVNIDTQSYFESGRESGIDEQKSKLESITITENGTYNKDDGYNKIVVEVDTATDDGSYDEGYVAGIEDQKSKLESITITENGTYDKEDGYNNVNVAIDTQSYFERGYNIGVEDGIDEQKSKLESITITENGTYNKDDGYNKVDVNIDTQSYYDNGYNNGYSEGDNNGYERGYGEGVDNGIQEQKAKLESITIKSNGTYNKDDGYNEIVVEVEATDEGSYDEGYAAGIEDQKSKLESITIKSNGTYNKEDGYNKVIVEVEGGSGESKPKIYNGFRFVSEGNNDYKRIKDIDFSQYDWSGVYELDNFFSEFDSTDGGGLVSSDFDNFIQNYNGKILSCYYMFYHSGSLKESPNFGDKTKNCLDMRCMFEYCSNLTSVQYLNTSNVTDMYYMFAYCSNLTSIPQLDTSKVTDMGQMFFNCLKLNSIPLLNCQNVNYLSGIFGSSYFGGSGYSSITYCGGFKDLGKQSSVSGIGQDFLSYAPNLTHESLMNVINNLYDRKSNGLSTTTVKFGTTNLNKLTDEEKSIAVNKGWILS